MPTTASAFAVASAVVTSFGVARGLNRVLVDAGDDHEWIDSGLAQDLSAAGGS
jgi:hypothetical protein